jgi:hypothetical protein
MFLLVKDLCLSDIKFRLSVLAVQLLLYHGHVVDRLLEIKARSWRCATVKILGPTAHPSRREISLRHASREAWSEVANKTMSMQLCR